MISLLMREAQSCEQEIRDIIGVGYDIKNVDIFECKAEEFLQGFDFGDQDTQIDLESSVEEIESKAQEAAEEDGEKEVKEPPKPQIAPGDFVIKSKEPGKHKTLAKDKNKVEKASFISVNVSKMDQLMELIGELVISESVVLQSPDLKVPRRCLRFLPIYRM